MKLYAIFVIAAGFLGGFMAGRRPTPVIDTQGLAAQRVRPTMHPDPLWQELRFPERQRNVTTPQPYCDPLLQQHQEAELRGMQPIERECGR